MLGILVCAENWHEGLYEEREDEAAGRGRVLWIEEAKKEHLAAGTGEERALVKRRAPTPCRMVIPTFLSGSSIHSLLQTPGGTPLVGLVGENEREDSI